MESCAKQWKYLDLFSSLFIACLLTANIVAVKLLQFGPFILPAGTIIFPISYIINDLLTEVYGFRNTHRIIWLGFLANLFLVVSIIIVLELPSAPFWGHQTAFEQILGFAPRLLVASFLAYLIGSISNAWIMAKMKLLTKGRWLWTRTIGSTIVGEGLDSFLFMFVAFNGIMPTTELFKSTVQLWLVKTFYEILVTPLIYIVVIGMKCAEGFAIDSKYDLQEG